MNAVQGYGSDSEEEDNSLQPVASGSGIRQEEELDGGEDVIVDSNDVFGLDGVAKSDASAGSRRETSALVKAAPEVPSDVSMKRSSICIVNRIDLGSYLLLQDIGFRTLASDSTKRY